MSYERTVKTLETLATFLGTVDKRVDAAIAAGKLLPCTTLAKELAPQFNMHWQQAYHIINLYVDADISPNLYVKGGKGGGIGLK